MNSKRLTLIAIALLSGVSVAAAADTGMSKSGSAQDKMAKPSSAAQTKDTLSLNSTQREKAWNDISKLAAKIKAPSGFTAKVGAAVPSTITTHPVPVTTASDVPVLRPYEYAMLDSNKLLIVNPSDKKVVEIITE